MISDRFIAENSSSVKSVYAKFIWKIYRGWIHRIRSNSLIVLNLPNYLTLFIKFLKAIIKFWIYSWIIYYTINLPDDEFINDEFTEHEFQSLKPTGEYL